MYFKNLISEKEMKMKLIIPIGPAGSGKTTLWKKIATNSNTIIRISADRYRYKLYDYNNSFKEMFENEVWQSVWNQFIKSLQNKKDIFLDATNLTKSRRLPFIFVARTFGYEILLETTIIETFKRNNSRKRIVPESIIINQVFSLEYPEPSEYDFLEYKSNKIQVWKKK